MILDVDDVDWNEGRLLLRYCWLTVLSTMLLEPKMNGVDGTTDVAGDLGGGLPGFKNEGESLLTDLVAVADARHDVLRAGGMGMQSDDRIDDATNYHTNTKSGNNAIPGALTILFCFWGMLRKRPPRKTMSGSVKTESMMLWNGLKSNFSHNEET